VVELTGAKGKEDNRWERRGNKKKGKGKGSGVPPVLF